MDDKADLAAYARDCAANGADLYALLGVDESTAREDIHRAWRRQGLKYHPDKAGANFDPALYERFARARDVLIDDAAREIYNGARAAAAQRQRQADQMTAERRRFKDELEAAERGNVSGAAPFSAPTHAGPPLSSERDKLREAGRRREDERRRRDQEAKDRLRQREDERIAEIEQRLREKEERSRRRAEKKAARGPAADGGATARIPAAATTTDTAQPTPDTHWRTLLTTGEAARKPGPVTQRPLYAYTLDRLRAADEAQRRKAGDTTPFLPQWDAVQDPQVKKYIARVPRLDGAVKTL